METTISLPETKHLQDKALSAIERAEAIQIRTTEEYQGAGEFLKVLKGIQNEIENTFKEPIEAAYKAHKTILAAKNKHLEPLALAEAILKPKIGVYLSEQERLRREEERRLQDEARKKAEDEALAAAEQAEKEGRHEEAKAILEQPVQAAPVILPKQTSNVDGISMRDNWRAEVLNLGLLIKAVAAGQVPTQALQANTVFLNQQARALKGSLNYPGVRPVAEKIVASRSAA